MNERGEESDHDSDEFSYDKFWNDDGVDWGQLDLVILTEELISIILYDRTTPRTMVVMCKVVTNLTTTTYQFGTETHNSSGQ